MNPQYPAERLAGEIGQLIDSMNRLVQAFGGLSPSCQETCPQCGRPFAEGDMEPEALSDEADPAAGIAAAQEVKLGSEIDQCSGVLTVCDRHNQWIKVPRGRWTAIDVAIDGNGYWYWRCGSTLEKSRGAASFRQRVKRLKVKHSTESRKITWHCFDLL